MAEKWMQKAAAKMKKKGTVGLETKKAEKAHGMTKKGTIKESYLEKEKAKGGKAAQRANFALNARKAARGK